MGKWAYLGEVIVDTCTDLKGGRSEEDPGLISTKGEPPGPLIGAGLAAT
jgi:hypothetical protein